MYRVHHKKKYPILGTDDISGDEQMSLVPYEGKYMSTALREEQIDYEKGKEYRKKMEEGLDIIRELISASTGTA